jgi:NADPH2:quinone reductase
VAFKAAIAQALISHVWPLLTTRTIRPVIHTVFDAVDAPRAHALMESGEHVGKLVLEWRASPAN